ncbi:hypothetical protein H7J07_19845 [Mycobacterium koreense]|uniref:Uncharacterized protein n=1 Tax=Mycolicibacillus koreensis TaxID=1069220 RepID=A0A7I7SIF9_9MYCO|nr:hypothetical protein [Mycolicibacillus koreensis]MCV7250448.1 hypothetical protein [Mycolicibacillus koreensis]OSC27777.1 hypothetical protein B8W67_18015 [Mycolicibacillus koreensis]BBY55785.1 hypothetical protein MKOR_30360 [Mycolicibacillus koreensis]
MTRRRIRTLLRTFVGLRLATGVAAWVAPNTTGRLIGLNSGRDQPFTAQLFGARELVLALAVAAPGPPSIRTRALQWGLAVDVLDVVAAARGVRAGTLAPTGVIITGGGAASFAALGVAALSGQSGQVRDTSTTPA